MLNNTSAVAGKVSRKEITNKKAGIESHLHASFLEQQGCEVNRAIVQSCLGLGDGDDSLLTRTIKQVFPKVSIRRDRQNDMYPFILILTFLTVTYWCKLYVGLFINKCI